MRTLRPGLSGVCGTAGSLGEDDLPSRGQRVELADGDDAVHLLYEVVRAAYPAARVVLVSPAADPERRALAISHGADAYVVNDDGGERLRGELHARF